MIHVQSSIGDDAFVTGSDARRRRQDLRVWAHSNAPNMALKQ